MYGDEVVELIHITLGPAALTVTAYVNKETGLWMLV